METHGNGSSQTPVDADGNGSSSLTEPNETQQADDKVTAFMKFAYEELTNERDLFRDENMALRFKYLELEKKESDSKKDNENEIARLHEAMAELEATNKKHLNKVSTLEKQQQADRQARDEERKALESVIKRAKKLNAELEAVNKKQLENITRLVNLQQLTQEKWGEEREMLKGRCAQMKQSLADLQPNVFKKLISCDDCCENSWHCHSDEKEGPVALLSMIDPSLVIDGAVSQIILDGSISHYKNNPFITSNFNFWCYDRLSISRLLQKVHSCYLTGVYISNQSLTWMEYEKLVSGGLVQNLYFSCVEIKDENGVVPLENILEKLPNIQKFAYFGYFNVTKHTFTNLIKLPYFAMLKEFNLNVIRYQDLDADSFLDFMKKHPNAHFSFSYFSYGFCNYSKTQLESMKLLERRASPFQLEIKY